MDNGYCRIDIFCSSERQGCDLMIVLNSLANKGKERLESSCEKGV